MAEKSVRPTLTYADEAHRLNAKSGMFHNLGENQVKEIIYAAYCSVFFIDESQRVTMDDIGSVAEIEKWAKEEVGGATLTKMSKNKLVSTEVLMKICEALHCNIGDIVDFIEENSSDDYMHEGI